MVAYAVPKLSKARKLGRKQVLLVAVFACGTHVSGQETQPAGSPPTVNVADNDAVRQALQKLDVWLEGRLLKDHLTSLAVGVVYDQQLVWSKGYGYADVARQVPATDQTLYRVASITKLFTATAVMQLVERGKLSLEDPVQKYLKWFTPPEPAAADPVLVWHLLTHTGGLQREIPGMDWDKLEVETPAEVEAAAALTPLKFPPQVRQKYSNYAFMVAGQLVEQVAGVPYREYVEARIFQPLGMSGTRVLNGDETDPQLAVPYGRRCADGLRPIEPQMPGSALQSVGGIATSVRDLARFASLQFCTGDDYTGPVLTGRSLREMHRPRWLAPDWGRGQGIGWFLLRRDRTILLAHEGGLPGFRSALLINPVQKVAVIVLSNSDEANVGAIGEGALGVVTGPIEKAAQPAEPPVAADADLARFEGLYRNRWGEHLRVAIVGGKLCVLAIEADDIQAGTTTLERLGPTTFRTHVGELRMGGDVEDVVEFAVDAEGHATSFTKESGAYRFHRVN
ncbi:MAG TPA: serine hydrolase [Phycisphaerae bacterium]|nr:serine hydrolase [Phycisphaerae bacterium]HNU46413.1 serine hydrolase [Phycisphaerae bacterium]